MNINLRNLAPAFLAAFVVVGIGAATTAVRPTAETVTPAKRVSSDETLQRLEDYARSPSPHGAAKPSGNEPLPDVDTLIASLASRLASAPNDVKGWRMLGWSYFNTGRYADAAAAYQKAIDLDPGSAELRRFHDEAKSKAALPGEQRTGPAEAQ